MGKKDDKTKNENPKGGPLTAEVLATLKSRASSKDAKRKGTIFCQFFETDPAVIAKLEEQLKAYDIVYQIEDDPSGKGKVINVIGAKNKNGELVMQQMTTMTRETERLPTTGEWKTKDGLVASRGDGYWFPDPKAVPKGYPNDPPKEETEKQKEKRLRINRQKAQIQRVDAIMPMYDAETGEIIRYPWGEPGDSQKNPVPQTLTAQIEVLVAGHRNRHKKEGEPDVEYKFNGVKYENNKPMMEEYSMGTVKTNFYSTDRTVNFKNADELMAQQLNEEYKKKNGEERNPPYTITEVKKYREKNDLTWHEDPDCQTMMKIPSILHSNAAHKGGVSEENKLGMEVFGGQSNTTTGTGANVEKGQSENVSQEAE